MRCSVGETLERIVIVGRGDRTAESWTPDVIGAVVDLRVSVTMLGDIAAMVDLRIVLIVMWENLFSSWIVRDGPLKCLVVNSDNTSIAIFALWRSCLTNLGDFNAGHDLVPGLPLTVFVHTFEEYPHALLYRLAKTNQLSRAVDHQACQAILVGIMDNEHGYVG